MINFPVVSTKPSPSLISRFIVVLACFCSVSEGAENLTQKAPAFLAGVAAVDITPTQFPVIVNGQFLEGKADRAHDRLMSRAMVLDDGETRLAIVVVDSLMIQRHLLDDAKEMAHESTGIPTDRMLISATHTHSAPSAMGCLGSRPDVEYQQFLVGQIAKSIHQADEKMQPAKVGWTVVKDYEHNHCRRWIYRPDRMASDPFGVRNVRAHMHPGHQSQNHIAPSGPADTDLSLISVQTKEGQPLGVLANYALHYYGAPLISGDFCGRFGNKFAELIGVKENADSFVGIMSQGTSGDSMWMDYGSPAQKRDLDQYTLEVAQVVHEAYKRIQYQDHVSLGMAEAKLKLQRRTPDEERLKWSQSILKELGEQLPKSRAEIYAREQIYLHEEPEVEIKLQAVRIGEIGITAIPNEVYGLTGLKIKAQSPLQPTFNIELANGAQGYIPPPEQHALGGYTTWPARTAGLEVQAEPQIVETLLGLLEKVAGKPRRAIDAHTNAYSTSIFASKPTAYWRFNEMSGSRAVDAVGQNHGTYENGVAYFLPGFAETPEQQKKTANRAAHFAGGRMQSELKGLGDTWAAELWFWNGLPNDARAVTGYILSRGTPGQKDAAGDHLGIGGTYQNAENAGKLIFFNGNEKDELLVGKTVLPTKTWNHVAMVRDGQQVKVYLNGNTTPEISGEISVSHPKDVDDIFVGGRNDGLAPFEGKLSEVAIYKRVLSPKEIASHFKAAGFESAEQQAESSPTTGSITPEDPPLSPEETLAATHIRDGYQIELVAAEPLVKDPVAIAWGTDGRLWVAEMADYPLGMDGKGKPGGRVRYLEDTNNDGQYDRSTLFLDGIRFPTGLMPWRNGVLITAAPEILFAEDTTGDGKADKQEVLYSGFQEGNQQLRVNGLRWGLDNWIYCASGAHHGGYGADRKLHSTKSGATVELGSRDFRFRPDTGDIDPQSGPSQFGRNRDDWGNWFGQQNSFPLWHFVLQDHYLRRNPHFAPPDPRKILVGERNPKVYPAKSPQKRFHGFEQSGRFTSACSAIVYRDELLFPQEFSSEHAFTCEPFHNLVQHNVIETEGPSFMSHRDSAEKETDFFASKDRWCRPVMVRTGPDGALWVVDMYRYMIEHPHWLPPEGQKELEPFYRSGENLGRIYRIVPKDQKPRPIQNLETLAPVELVDLLNSPSGEQRDLASQLIQWKNDPATVAPLEEIARKSENPLGRLHALCTLDGLGKLTPSIVQQALQDAHPGVRRHAIRLAEPMGEQHPELITKAIELADDADARVRLQLSCTLGEWSGKASADALVDLTISDANDPYLVSARMSSINQSNLSDVLAAALLKIENPAAGHLVGQLLAFSVAFENQAATLDGLEAVLKIQDPELKIWQLKTMAELFDALQRRELTLKKLVSKSGQRGEALRLQMNGLVEQALFTAVDPNAKESLRMAAIPLLARDPDTRSAELSKLASLLTPQTPPSVQVAVVRHLGASSDKTVSNQLLEGWSSHGPALRNEILAVLSTRREWLTDLLDAIESGSVARTDIGASARQVLSAYRDKAIRERVTKLLAESGSEDRRQVVQDHQNVLSLKGSASRGKEIFKKQCSTCHKLDNVGFDIGPNLRSLTDMKPSSLLTSILDPSAAVDGKFVTYVAATDDGRVYTGIMAAETANSITLVEQEKKQRVILRNQLEEIRSTGKSLMPEGLEKTMKPQDFADVIEYVRQKDSK
ncbi:neutral/alkaline non-lysosomal ceramidase N-terminal domain-containing protein [Thalassoglobus sp.]|uniref:neutral/alkaline non-lysosomal ceramidase N-terminal domain-containing protein n=1 Tax=Thalassoglobus sp. TaxID=2795869 RepID=UPI003AA87281